MIKCPYCNHPAMSLGRKAGLGPGRVVGCQSCGKPVATHWIAIFAAVPAFLGGFVLLRSESMLLGIAAVVVGVVAMALLQMYLVPLVKGE